MLIWSKEKKTHTNYAELGDDEPYTKRFYKNGRSFTTTKNKERKSEIIVSIMILLLTLTYKIFIVVWAYANLVSTSKLSNKVILILVLCLFAGFPIGFEFHCLDTIKTNIGELKKAKSKNDANL